jgi:ribonuclease D
MSAKQSSYLLVEDEHSLGRMAVKLKDEPAIAVDLEADSLFHYQEKVCLIQISTPLQNILVDPLALHDLSPLSPVFADHQIQKVFHGADNDIRSLHRDFGIEVNALFDTQIAARFVGSTETGLATLLKERLGVLVDKKYQKKDWSKRPLPPAMLDYAVQDTVHLLRLSRMLEKELLAKNRLLWVKEECGVLSKVRQDPPGNGPFFLRFKGASRLDGRSLAVLESMLQLRDKAARRRNLPPFKVLGNAPIMEIATKKPRSEAELVPIKGLSAGQVRTLGNSILRWIEKAMSLPEDNLPAFPKRKRQQMDAKSSGRAKVLKSWRSRRAKEMGVDPSLICTNAQIQSIAIISPKGQEELARIPGVRAWQRKLFGDEICALLQGTGFLSSSPLPLEQKPNP